MHGPGKRECTAANSLEAVMFCLSAAGRRPECWVSAAAQQTLCHGQVHSALGPARLDSEFLPHNSFVLVCTGIVRAVSGT